MEFERWKNYKDLKVFRELFDDEIVSMSKKIVTSNKRVTNELDTLNKGDSIQDVIGPLGKPVEVKNYGTVACVAGGVGTPEILPVANALRKAGNKVITIAGFRSKDLLILEDLLNEFSDDL